MEDRRTMSLNLERGESRQILLAAGSTVLLLSGRICVGTPLAWLAESLLRTETKLMAEESMIVDAAGWIELTAVDRAQIVLLPPDAVPLWRQVGRCLEALAGRPSSLPLVG